MRPASTSLTGSHLASGAPPLAVPTSTAGVPVARPFPLPHPCPQCANPDTLKFALLDQRGFVLHHLTRACYHAEFHFVSTVQKKKYSHYCAAVFEAEAGKRGQLKKGVRYMTIDGAVPERERPRRSALLRSACDILPHKW